MLLRSSARSNIGALSNARRVTTERHTTHQSNTNERFQFRNNREFQTTFGHVIQALRNFYDENLHDQIKEAFDLPNLLEKFKGCVLNYILNFFTLEFLFRVEPSLEMCTGNWTHQRSWVARLRFVGAILLV